MIPKAVFEVAPYLILFLLFQMPHAVVMRISMSTWEWFSWNSQSKSMKSWGFHDWLGGWILRVVHTSLAKLHFKKTCLMVSTFSHRSQSTSIGMWRSQSRVFIGSMFLQACQAKFRILLGHFSPHINFHKAFIVELSEHCPSAWLSRSFLATW